jgi:hypothetical protein
MASWGKADAYTSAPLWAAARVKLAPTSTNIQSLFENTTADNFITNLTVGLFNYSASETQSSKVAHSGWVLKTTGKSGSGRSGRVQYETLVTLTSNS